MDKRKADANHSQPAVGPGSANSIWQASLKLNCSLRTTQKLLAERQIGFVRIGRRVVITDAQIAEFLERNAVPAVDAAAEARRIFGG